MAPPPTDKLNLTLFRGWRDPGKHVWSPFVVKLEARLRFAGISYVADVGSARAAPYGKIPYIQYQAADEAEPTALGDSTLIIKHLVERGILPDVNAELSAEGKMHDLAVRALLEDKLYFYHSRERWGDNYYTMRDHALWSIPFPMRVLVGLLVSRNVTNSLHGQGTGRLPVEQLRAFRKEIWDTINAALTSSKAKAQAQDGRMPFWILGHDTPTEADATLFGFIVSVLICTACPESKQLVKSYPVVVEYAERIHDKYFPDYEKWP